MVNGFWEPGDTTPDYPLGEFARIDQGTGGFDNWELAAVAVGAAAGKTVPITVDSIEYYNRTAAPDGLVANWDYASGFILPQEANDEGCRLPEWPFRTLSGGMRKDRDKCHYRHNPHVLRHQNRESRLPLFAGQFAAFAQSAHDDRS